MRNDLHRRLTRLERPQEDSGLPRFIVITHPIDALRRNALGPDEHIVLDWYSDVDGHILARERITSDATDQGWHCEPQFSGRRFRISERLPPFVIRLTPKP